MCDGVCGVCGACEGVHGGWVIACVGMCWSFMISCRNVMILCGDLCGVVYVVWDVNIGICCK